MQAFKKIFSLILRIGISIILLIFSFKFNKIDVHGLLQDIKSADKIILILSFCVFLLSYVLALLRWHMLLRALKIHLPLKRVIISFSGGIFFNTLMPSTIGGDLMRSIDLASLTKRPREIIATVFLDRLSGYVGLVILALLSLMVGWRFIPDKSVIFSIAIITGLLVIILLVFFNKFLYSKINKLLHNPRAGKMRELLQGLHREIHYFRHHKKIIVKNLIISILVQSIAPITFFIIALSLGLQINMIYFFIFLPIISAITLLPISIGGFGLREATATIFFPMVGVASSAAIAMSLLNSFFVFVCGAIGGLIYVLTIHHRRIQHH
jgi:uncharacterized protein (TIRG00374 family)